MGELKMDTGREARDPRFELLKSQLDVIKVAEELNDHRLQNRFDDNPTNREKLKQMILRFKSAFRVFIQNVCEKENLDFEKEVTALDCINPDVKEFTFHDLGQEMSGGNYTEMEKWREKVGSLSDFFENELKEEPIALSGGDDPLAIKILGDLVIYKIPSSEYITSYSVKEGSEAKALVEKAKQYAQGELRDIQEQMESLRVRSMQLESLVKSLDVSSKSGI